MIGRLLKGLIAKLKAQAEAGPNIAPSMLSLDETQPQTQFDFDFGPSLMHRDQRQMLAVGGISRILSKKLAKLLKKHRQDPEVLELKYKIEDTMDEIGSFGDDAKYRPDETMPGSPGSAGFTYREAIEELETDLSFYSERLEDKLLDLEQRKPKQEGGQIEELIKDIEKAEEIVERDKKQEGGILMEEQMGELMPEEAPIPLEIAEETTETMLPDEEMEDSYTDFVVDEALNEEEEQYLLDRLSEDDQLSMIFDKVVETASEFSGSGSIEGPGSAVSDSIPARLSDGEFVMTAKASDQIGPGVLQELMALAEQEADTGRRTEQAGGYITEEEEDKEIVQPIVSDKVVPEGRVLPETIASRRNKELMTALNPRNSLFAS